MTEVSRIGKYTFAAALVAFGVQYCISASPLAGPAVGPPWLPVLHIWAVLLGVLFIAVGVGIVVDKTTRVAAHLFGLLLLLFVLIYYVPKIIAQLHDPGPWTSSSEVLALCAAALFIAALLPLERAAAPEWSRRLHLAERYSTLLFAAGLIVFGVQHFMYGTFVATLIPSWIPGRLFWAYLVGAAFFAAALAISTGIQSRLAAILLGVMFFLWVLILHLPRVVAAPSKGSEWTSALIALAMAGASFVFASHTATRGLAGQRNN
jgi:uncharacterized membrane protein